MEKLSAEQIDARMPVEFPEWSLVGESITRTFQLQDFQQSMVFVGQIAVASEAAEHHPDILIRYSKVTLTLSTHEAGGITAQDFALAETLDRIASLLLHTAT